MHLRLTLSARSIAAVGLVATASAIGPALPAQAVTVAFDFPGWGATNATPLLIEGNNPNNNAMGGYLPPDPKRATVARRRPRLTGPCSSQQSHLPHS